MKHLLTREQLHDMVWTRAVSKVAPELGISDVALRKQCVKHQIPVPDSRYWGLYHAGKPVKRMPLPPAHGVPDKVIIFGRAHEPMPADVKAAVDRARARAKPVQVPDRLHPLAAMTLKVAKHRARDGDGVVILSDPDVFAARAHREALDRLGNFLNLLVRHALARSYRFEPGKHGLLAVVEEERIGFKLNQTIRRSHHVATDEEKARQARWDARHRGWGSWEGRPSIPYWDFTPTGAMALEIEGWQSGCQSRFADSKATQLELRIDAILDGFHAWALRLKRDREEARLEAIAAEERRRQRIEEERLAAVEQCRRDYVSTLHGRCMDLDQAKRVLALLRRTDGQVEDYANWLDGHISQLQASLSGATIEAELGKLEGALAEQAEKKLARPKCHGLVAR